MENHHLHHHAKSAGRVLMDASNMDDRIMRKAIEQARNKARKARAY